MARAGGIGIGLLILIILWSLVIVVYALTRNIRQHRYFLFFVDRLCLSLIVISLIATVSISVAGIITIFLLTFPRSSKGQRKLDPEVVHRFVIHKLTLEQKEYIDAITRWLMVSIFICVLIGSLITYFTHISKPRRAINDPNRW